MPANKKNRADVVSTLNIKQTVVINHQTNKEGTMISEGELGKNQTKEQIKWYEGGATKEESIA